MFTGGFIWSIDRTIAIRTNRIQAFLVSADGDTATLIVSCVKHDDKELSIPIEQLSNQESMSAEQFENYYQNQFKETVAQIVTMQTEDHLAMQDPSRKIYATTLNSVDWTKSAQ